MPVSTRYHRIISGSDRSGLAGLARMALTAAAGAYRMGVVARNASFKIGLRHVHNLGRPTLSVGNLTAGGTGKTPMVIELTQRLHVAGARPAVLLRGYHAGDSGSDEATLLREQIGPGVPVMTSAKRSEAAARVLSDHPQTSVFILDDGFQHRQAKRNLDLVLIDATRPFGYGHMLPRGLLREPAAELRRADAVILTRADQCDDPQAIAATVEQITGQPPIAQAAYKWSGFRDGQGTAVDKQVLQPIKVIGVCGIGNPTGFERSLRDHCKHVASLIAHPDHHHYSRDDLSAVQATAQRVGADAIVTTDKDWVKWQGMLDGMHNHPPIYRPVMSTQFLSGEQAIEGLLSKLLDPTRKPRVS